MQSVSPHHLSHDHFEELQQSPESLLDSSDSDRVGGFLQAPVHYHVA